MRCHLLTAEFGCKDISRAELRLPWGAVLSPQPALCRELQEPLAWNCSPSASHLSGTHRHNSPGVSGVNTSFS